MGTRAEAAAREAGWRERQVTADPVGAGRYAIDQSPAETPTFVEVNIYSGDITTLVEPVRSEAVDADENEVAEAPVSPPNEQAELLAFTENGAVYRMDDYSTGSRLIYVPVEGQAKTVFSFNSHLAGTVPASAPLLIEHTDYEGNYAVSWLYLPPEASGDDSAQYPLVVIAYPGKTYDATPPTENDLYAGSIWTTPLSANTSVEVFAAQGYAVLLPSIKLGPNGGPGEPRTRIMSSLISALDGAIVTGHVDPERLVLSGHSYVGYGALAAAAQTDRFDAIIAMSVNSNLTSIYGQFTPGTRVNFADQIFFGQSRISSMETGQNRMGTPPWIDPQRYIRNSPLFFADQIGTPILIIHGDIDTATLMTQAEEMFTALRREDKDVLFVRYWGEGHIIQQPQNQRDMWQRIFAFLEDNGVTPGPREMEPIEASAPH